MAARPNEVMPVPIDTYAGIGESFVTAVERDVVIDLAFILFCEMFGAGQARFFISRKDKNQIALSLNLGVIEGAAKLKKAA